jgi:hypothetical protein
VILRQDALLVEADAYHDAVESMLFMMGMGYIFSATLQTYQLLTLRRSKCVLPARSYLSFPSEVDQPQSCPAPPSGTWFDEVIASQMWPFN